MTSRFIPRIIITCASPERLPRSPELYRNAVNAAGGEAVFVAQGVPPAELADRHDGLMIPGGRDLLPSRYGESPILRIEPEDEARTDFELAVLREIIRRDKPVLGICYGMQLINVFFGGTLYQDIAMQVPGSPDHRSGEHDITVSVNDAMETGVHTVNTSHHQAVHELGKGLTACAVTADGLIEAFYGGSYRFLLGVQWHPERLVGRLSAGIFLSFVRACRGR